jgi:DNA repair protein RadA/Sms
MAKNNTHYVCQECGSIHKKWSGKCEDCGAWNSLEEEKFQSPTNKKPIALQGQKASFETLDNFSEDFYRITTNINELDRVLGGGLVMGSAILIGGDPGIGKSTLLLQLVSQLSKNSIGCAYITGEESMDQVRLRAKRLGLNDAPVKLLSATNVADIITSINAEQELQLVVIDSIQTMFVNDYNSAPGTVSQVRAAAHELINVAKAKGVIMILVGHVTKEGQLAGPKVLEHMVDTVLYFEGERGHHFRILRAVKNRYGGVNEIGVFEMSDQGLVEVTNPSALFLSGNQERAVPGSVVFAGIEGTRPVLCEIQALTAPSYMPSPRRSVVGWDLNRLAMIIAVLAVRYGTSLAEKEVYLNVAGGLKVLEPAADLAVACSLLSSVTGISLPAGTIVFGEVGLSGEIRRVNHADIRLKEAIKLGFTSAIIPTGSKFTDSKDIQIHEIAHVKQLKNFFK